MGSRLVKQSYFLEVTAAMTVAELKVKIMDSFNTPVARQILCTDGKRLRDALSLHVYNFQKNSQIVLTQES